MIRPDLSRGAVGALALSLATACGGDATGPVPSILPIDVAAPWSVAEPAALGLDAALLERTVQDAAALPRVRSLLVVRDGRLVLERYFGGMAVDSLADVRSVTKSIVSTLVGIALDRGDLSSADATMGELLGGVLPTLPESHRAVTVRDLLTMSGGWAWEETGTRAYNDWILSGNHLGYLLDRPVVDAPGTTFAYNSPAVHLLGAALQEAVGRPLPEYAQAHLFGPLGIAPVDWEDLPAGRVNAAAGIDLRPRDLARFGQLMLQEGVSGGDRIVSSDYVSLATRAAYPWRSPSGPVEVSYGYLWWTDETNAGFMAWGFGGQFVYVSPARKLVAVATTEWRRQDGVSVSPDLQLQVLGLITEGILPAAPTL